MNEIGIANLMDLEEKHNCKFVISSYSSKIKVLSKKENIKIIQSEVQERLHNHFFYRISLPSKVYKNYKEHPDILDKLQK